MKLDSLPKHLRDVVNNPQWRTAIREFVAHRASYRCEHCNRFLGMTGDCDHKVPRRECESFGIDPFDTDNLQWLCASCHSQKSNAERWNGHDLRPKPLIRRSKVRGRRTFLAAAGITANP